MLPIDGAFDRCYVLGACAYYSIDVYVRSCIRVPWAFFCVFCVCVSCFFCWYFQVSWLRLSSSWFVLFCVFFECVFCAINRLATGLGAMPSCVDARVCFVFVHTGV